MLISLSNYWWLFVLRGLLSMVFGLAALAYPDVSLIVILYLFAGFVLVEGSFLAVASLDFRQFNSRWWIYLCTGVAGAIWGMLTLFNPEATLGMLNALAAGWSLVIGALGLIAARLLQKELPNEWALMIGSLVSLLHGITLFLIGVGGGDQPNVWIIGLYALLFGLSMLVFGLRVKKTSLRNTARTFANFMR